MSEFWCDFQARVGGWKDRILPPEHNTARGEFMRSLEEIAELSKAIEEDDGSRQAEIEIAEESVDVIIRMLGIITVVNCNASELLEKKIEQIHEKYPPDKIEKQLQEGVPFPVAMAKQKTLWERRKQPRQ